MTLRHLSDYLYNLVVQQVFSESSTVLYFTVQDPYKSLGILTGVKAILLEL